VAKVTMPQLGESVAEGTIGKWLKQPGDHVDKYEPLVEVVTDKVNAEVPSPFEGILREILAEEGSVVPNNADIAVIETADDAASGAEAPAAPTAATAAAPDEAPAAAEATAKEAPVAAAAAPSAPTPAAAPAPSPGPAGSDERAPAEIAAAVAAPPATADPDARMTPAVRRLLREHELTAAQIVGTGGGGRITREDVLKVVESIRTGGAAPATAPAVATASGQNGSAAPVGAPAAPRAVSTGRPALPRPARTGAWSCRSDRPGRAASSPRDPDLGCRAGRRCPTTRHRCRTTGPGHPERSGPVRSESGSPPRRTW